MEKLELYLSDWFIMGLAIIGLITILLKPISLLISISSTLKDWWANFLEKRAKELNFKSLEKRAIVNKIEATVNSTVFELQKELPKNWSKKMHLKWVTKSNLKRLKDGQSILRIEPRNRQDHNIINGIYYYFNETLFPDTFEVVPARVLNALSINLSQRTINNKVPYLLKTFEDTIMEREIQQDLDVLKYIEPFKELDDRGFLTGAMVREIDDVANKIRHKALRNSFEEEILKMCDYMTEFASKLPKAPDHLWYYENKTHTYRFLLARNPGKMKIYIYLKRAQQAFDDGVHRLYVFGKNEDFKFTQKLIRRIDSDTGFIHIETFELDKDFSTNRNGIGAIFIRDLTVSKKIKKIETNV